MTTEKWLEVFVMGVLDPGPMLRIVIRCTFCGETLSDQQFDASVDGEGDRALEQGMADFAATTTHLERHQ